MLDKKWLIHCCKDRTLTRRTRDQPIFNGVAIAVYSVDTEQEADELILLVCSRQYEEHPLIPGKPWYKINVDFKRYLELEDLPTVTEKLRVAHERIRGARSGKESI